MGWAYERKPRNFRCHCVPLELNPPNTTTNQPSPPSSGPSTSIARRSLHQAIFSEPAKYTSVPDLSPDWDPEAEEQEQPNPQENVEQVINRLREQKIQVEVEARYRALSPEYLRITTLEQQAELERYKPTPAVATPTPAVAIPIPSTSTSSDLQGLVISYIPG